MTRPELAAFDPSTEGSLAEFVAGKINETVRQLFGQQVLDQALTCALAELAKRPP